MEFQANHSPNPAGSPDERYLIIDCFQPFLIDQIVIN